MGQDIGSIRFGAAEREEFTRRLAAETALLAQLADAGALSSAGPVGGYELEAWLVDRAMFPVPHNQSFLSRLGDGLVVSELSRFNIELNGLPRGLGGAGLAELEQELAATWSRCLSEAHEEVDTAIAIGILPTLRDADLSLDNMTPSNRYVALNREVMRLRGGAPVEIDIDCVDPAGEHLRTSHADVMLEAGTTSFQLHLQVPLEQLAATYDASLELAGPLVALSANSPFLFGKPLWHETRIPLFEQAMSGAGGEASDTARVFLASRYADGDPLALFAENLERFAVLLPILSDQPADRFAHLRLHNGTIWRWVRLLAGFDQDETPHVRLEQRIMPAGPSVIDMFANAAFYYGAVHALAQRPAALPLDVVRANFYAAARNGLNAEIAWAGEARRPVRDVLGGLLPLARQGLEQLGTDSALIDRNLGVIEQRIASGRNGATWQLAHHARHGDLFRLTADYLEHQRSGMPVHEWTV